MRTSLSLIFQFVDAGHGVELSYHGPRHSGINVSNKAQSQSRISALPMRYLTSPDLSGGRVADNPDANKLVELITDDVNSFSKI